MNNKAKYKPTFARLQWLLFLLRLCCPTWQPLATCVYWMLEMCLIQSEMCWKCNIYIALRHTISVQNISWFFILTACCNHILDILSYKYFIKMNFTCFLLLFKVWLLENFKLKCVVLTVFLLVTAALYHNNKGIYGKQDIYTQQKCYITRNNKNIVTVTYKIWLHHHHRYKEARHSG